MQRGTLAPGRSTATIVPRVWTTDLNIQGIFRSKLRCFISIVLCRTAWGLRFISAVACIGVQYTVSGAQSMQVGELASGTSSEPITIWKTARSRQRSSKAQAPYIMCTQPPRTLHNSQSDLQARVIRL